MPNWTENQIIVKGPKEVLDRMLTEGTKLDDGSYHFGSWFPIPETYIKYDTTNHPNGEYLEVGKPISWQKGAPVATEELIEEFKKATAEQKEKYGAVGWYNWNVMTYGCKWDSDFKPVRTDDDKLVITVDTPWSAPKPFLQKMSNRYPELQFDLYAHYEDCANECCSFLEGVEETIDGDFIKTPANDYILKKINERQDPEERVLLTKCVQRYFNRDLWKASILDPEDQYYCFLDMLPYISEDICGTYMHINKDGILEKDLSFYPEERPLELPDGI